MRASDPEKNPYLQYEDNESMLIPIDYFTKGNGETGVKLFCGEYAKYLCEQDSLTSAQSVKTYMKVKTYLKI